jgi:hypothetical protein
VILFAGAPLERRLSSKYPVHSVVSGFSATDVLMKAHRLRVERGDHHITDEHVADAIEGLVATKDRLPADVHAGVTS